MVTLLSDWGAYIKTKGKYFLAILAVAGMSLGGSLVVTAAPMPGAVRINEVYANPTAGDQEWVELRNMTSEAIDLSSWALKDTANNDFGTLANTTLPANGYVVIEDTGVLNNTGDSLTLSASATVIDTTTFGALTSTQSFVRYTNCVGTTGVETGIAITKSSVNPTKIADVIN